MPDGFRGVMDTAESRREFPEAFTYYCCDRDANSKGCKTGQHWAADDSRGGPPPFSDSDRSAEAEGADGGEEGEEGEDKNG